MGPNTGHGDMGEWRQSEPDWAGISRSYGMMKTLGWNLTQVTCKFSFLFTFALTMQCGPPIISDFFAW